MPNHRLDPIHSTSRFQLKVPEHTLALWRQAAALHGVTVNELIRESMRVYLVKHANLMRGGTPCCTTSDPPSSV